MTETETSIEALQLYNSGGGLQRQPSLFDNQKWVDTKGAASYLKISVGSLRNAVYRKQVIARKFRRRLYFKVSELNRLLENSTLL